MEHLQPAEYSNQRIMTTQQIAEAYETTEKIVSQNFTRNREHYVVGKHYFVLEGKELKDFAILNLRNANFGKIRTLYLWTEKGAFLHAKSIGTNKAWEVYETLVDEYFRLVREAPHQDKTAYQYDPLRPINDRWAALLETDLVEDHFSVQYAMNQSLYSMGIHRLQWDEDARPDGSQGGLFSRWMHGEKLPGCNVEPPPFGDPIRAKIIKVRQLVYITKSGQGIYGDVYCYPDEYRGYYELWYKRWWFPIHGEKYLSGDVRPGIPRVKNQEKIPEIMTKQTHGRWKPNELPKPKQRNQSKHRNRETA